MERGFGKLVRSSAKLGRGGLLVILKNNTNTGSDHAYTYLLGQRWRKVIMKRGGADLYPSKHYYYTSLRHLQSA